MTMNEEKAKAWIIATRPDVWGDACDECNEGSLANMVAEAMELGAKEALEKVYAITQRDPLPLGCGVGFGIIAGFVRSMIEGPDWVAAQALAAEEDLAQLPNDYFLSSHGPDLPIRRESLMEVDAYWSEGLPAGWSVWSHVTTMSEVWQARGREGNVAGPRRGDPCSAWADAKELATLPVKTTAGCPGCGLTMDAHGPDCPARRN